VHAPVRRQGGQGRTRADRARTGKPLTEEWFVRFRERRNEGLVAGVQPIRNAVAGGGAISDRFQGRIACCSGADRFKVELQLRKCGLLPYFEGRVFSGHETPRSKPFPDVYLAAMEPLGVRPERCAVVEDTVTGVRPASPPAPRCSATARRKRDTMRPRRLRAAGATVIFTDMAQLPSCWVAPCSLSAFPTGPCSTARP
jgi:beta-phosphoglucomutase-like phosphatase (HAD superfamily)